MVWKCPPLNLFNWSNLWKWKEKNEGSDNLGGLPEGNLPGGEMEGQRVLRSPAREHLDAHRYATREADRGAD